MTLIKKSATVPYQSQQMYDLVNDVARYQEFVPYCVESKILSSNEDEVSASLSFAKGGFHKAFTTCNRLQPHKLIEIRLVSGPFKRLQGFWRFEPIENHQATRVVLDLEFEFSNVLIAMAFGPIFNQIANMLVDVFCKRAHEVYGKN